MWKVTAEVEILVGKIFLPERGVQFNSGGYSQTNEALTSFRAKFGL